MFLVRNSPLRVKPPALSVCGVALMLLTLGACTPAARAPEPPTKNDGQAADESRVREIVASEELILALTPRLTALDESVVNLVLPDHQSRSLFHDQPRLRDLAGKGPLATSSGSTSSGSTSSGSTSSGSTSSGSTSSLQTRKWPLTARLTRRSIVNDSLWQPFFDGLAYVDHAHFFMIDGHFVDGTDSEFDSRIGFRAKCRLNSGKWAGANALIRVRWDRSEAPDASSAPVGGAWRIAEWELIRFTTTETTKLFFDEILATSLVDDSLLRRARESKHWEFATRHYYPHRRAKLPGGLTDDRFFPISTAHHPGLAIVDIDDDGFDDIYVTVRWGRNMLLRNRGDGTFDEIAADVGLDVDGRSNSAVFVDFDNDGDKDVVIARSLERSLYLINDNGRFVDRSGECVDVRLPFEATSVCAADYNNDGLIDVYFSTYHQDDVNRRIDADLSHPDHRIHQYLSEEDSSEIKQRFSSQHRSFINQIGPPNLLLVNRGGGCFAKSSHSRQVAAWRNSFQAAWSDFDDDGDVDLYVANDFSPDHLFRNDGERGFVDVSLEQGIDKIGFAMGVSWGDYDNDGRRDLYVSNMYSKAGRRITRQIRGLDERISLLATGNYLFRQQGSTFQLVSGLSPPRLTVARAGWAWGGQFADLNNDGFQDIYVSSGYYTAPEQFETRVDL